MLWQCSASVRIDWSPTDRHPFKDSCLRKPPQRREIFSMTGPWNYYFIISFTHTQNRELICFKKLPQYPAGSRTSQSSANWSHREPKCSIVWKPLDKLKINKAQFNIRLSFHSLEHIGIKTRHQGRTWFEVEFLWAVFSRSHLRSSYLYGWVSSCRWNLKLSRLSDTYSSSVLSHLRSLSSVGFEGEEERKC